MTSRSGFRGPAWASRLGVAFAVLAVAGRHPLAAQVAAAVAPQTAPAAPRADTLPSRLTDAEFWKLVTDFSEPTGAFPSENFTSNETGFQTIIPSLQKVVKPGSVYLGVGPEQNFTYIVALKPKLAFITDIRRQNLLQHLIYKSLFERATNRADFLSLLFSRPRPAGLDSNSTAAQLFDAYLLVPADSAAIRKNLADVLEHLTKTHGFTLTPDDRGGIGHVVEAFYLAGPQINYNYRVEGGFGGRQMVNYSALMRTTDFEGVNRTFLASEANYRAVREMQLRNAIIPVVGDFGGNKALRSIGAWLTERKGVVGAMYCSNVEQYLFQYNAQGLPNGGFENFYNAMATFPMDSSSTFIRSGRPGGGGGGFGGGAAAGGMGTSLLTSMPETIKAFKAGQLTSYQALLSLPPR